MDSSISTSAAGVEVPGVSVIGTSLDNDAGFVSVVISAEQAVKITNKIINPLVIFFIELLLLRWFRISYFSGFDIRSSDLLISSITPLRSINNFRSSLAGVSKLNRHLTPPPALSCSCQQVIRNDLRWREVSFCLPVLRMGCISRGVSGQGLSWYAHFQG